jgi:tubulin--tyrosine ligase-like protein 12
LQPAPLEQDYHIDFIVNNIFKISGCYRLASSDQLDESSTWYINDEVGSMIPHSDTPNVKLIPFLYAPNFKLDSEVQAFSLLWPLKDISPGESLHRDYLNGMK